MLFGIFQLKSIETALSVLELRQTKELFLSFSLFFVPPGTSPTPTVLPLLFLKAGEEIMAVYGLSCVERGNAFRYGCQVRFGWFRVFLRFVR